MTLGATFISTTFTSYFATRMDRDLLTTLDRTEFQSLQASLNDRVATQGALARVLVRSTFVLAASGLPVYLVFTNHLTTVDSAAFDVLLSELQGFT